VATIFEKDGYRVMVYLRDEHPPAHVHVVHGDTVIVILIDGGVARFREGSWRSRRPSEREIQRATQIVAERIGDCVNAWNRYHG
jgi:Domain of unknown function (DUF4160)